MRYAFAVVEPVVVVSLKKVIQLYKDRNRQHVFRSTN